MSPGQVWTGAGNLDLTGIRPSDCLARSYPIHILYYILCTVDIFYRYRIMENFYNFLGQRKCGGEGGGEIQHLVLD